MKHNKQNVRKLTLNLVIETNLELDMNLQLMVKKR
jgi:hypothetical protein